MTAGRKQARVLRRKPSVRILPRRFSPVVPVLSLLGLVLMAQTVGSEQRFGASGPVQQSQGAAKAPAQTSGQKPPSTSPQGPGQGQRPPLTTEQVLAGWIWWKDEAVQKDMKLTSRQVSSINQIFERRVRAVTPFHEDLKKQLVELDRMTNERTVDVATFSVQVSRAEDLRSKLNETRTVMLYEISRQLSPEQVAKLKELREQRDRRRMGRGNSSQPKTW